MSNKASSTEKVNLPSKSSLLVYSEDILGFRKAFSIADNDYDQCLTGLRKIDICRQILYYINKFRVLLFVFSALSGAEKAGGRGQGRGPVWVHRK